jgi:hypothetical protein
VVLAFIGKHVAREKQQGREKWLARIAGYQKLRMIMATSMVSGWQHELSWKVLLERDVQISDSGSRFFFMGHPASIT